MDLLSTNFNSLLEFCKTVNQVFPETEFFLFHDLHKGKIKPIFTNQPNHKSFEFVEEPSITADLVNIKTVDQRDSIYDFLNHFHICCGTRMKLPAHQIYFAAVSVPRPYRKYENFILSLFIDFCRETVRQEILQKRLDTLLENRKKVSEEMIALHEISRLIQSSQNLDSLLHYVIEKCMKLMNAEAASLMMVVEGTDELEFKVALGPKSSGVKPFRVKIGKGISGWVAQQGESVLIPDAYADPRFDPSFDKRSGFRTRSYLCVPMKYKENILGVMTVLNRLDDQPFTENDKDLLQTFASQAALAIENVRLLKTALEKERLDRELQIAADIQNQLIPQRIPKIRDLDISATYIPCKEVGGDFYNVMPLPGDQYAFVVADVSGKGIPGAMLVSNMQASLKAFLEYSQDLLEVVPKLNNLIIENTTEDSYITFFIALYNATSGALTYVNAGHNPPLLLNSRGEWRKLDRGGVFLGFMPWEYTHERVMLENDTVLTLYTDGLVEAMNDREEEYGEKRLIKILKENLHLSSEMLKSVIIQDVHKHIGSVPLQDDFTLLVIKKK